VQLLHSQNQTGQYKPDCLFACRFEIFHSL
jgi:hypothetical protein